jgi:hypothetical protein
MSEDKWQFSFSFIELFPWLNKGIVLLETVSEMNDCWVPISVNTNIHGNEYTSEDEKQIWLVSVVISSYHYSTFLHSYLLDEWADGGFKQAHKLDIYIWII